ncbi:MAG TPA: HAMP domain-containing sensor histidine kinase, partial [Planctomycetota bacterium]|nr:HAMP domain-containing sensor histidine kinase [Planctomycetota bacterium]
MVQLRTQRTALVLYGVLLVLPTLVLGGLQWNQIVQDKIDELAAVPREADDAVRRLRDTVYQRLRQVVELEEQRPFQHYGQFFYPASADASEEGLPPSPILTPLEDARRPTGLLCWFSFDLTAARRGRESRIDLFWGDGRDDELGGAERARAATHALLQANLEDEWLRRAIRLGDYEKPYYPLRDMAANRAEPEDQECFIAQDESMRGQVLITISRIHILVFSGASGELRVAATRRVLMDPDERLRGLNPCLDRLAGGVGLMQGFYIDPAWLFGELPRSVAENVLDSSQRFVGPGEVCCEGDAEVHAELSLFDALGLEVRDPVPPGLAKVRIAVDTAGIEARFRARMWRFLGVATMLAISLTTGMVLLLRSVSADLRQAQRTENFVASVTHELRTPLASIKLHGEMLLDGWASDPDKQREYYRRIVRETERLSTMVERVLEKARLSAGAARPHPGDLNRLIDALAEQLVDAGEAQPPDLVFDLAPDLSQVMLTPEAVTSILVNLVENARKYAPFDPAREGSEPIRVVTRATPEGVRLAVLDRGPGIPAAERGRVFDAFYRLGNKATRTSRGTGLGLHLVRLQAESIGARVRVEGRPGGGAAFR